MAQQADSLAQYAMDTLQVRATRTTISSATAPLSLSTMQRSNRELKSTASPSLSSITNGLPGLWVSDRQNNALGERITIRGIGWRAAFGVRGIQLVLNGIPLTVADGQSITNMIDPLFITDAELIRGPAASYWGNAAGGVLYLSTEPNYSTEGQATLRMQGGSYGNQTYGAQYSQQVGRHKVNIFGSYRFSEGYRNYSQSKLLRGGLQGSQTFADNSRLSYTGAFIYMPQAQHPSGLTSEQVQQNPRQANDNFRNAEAGKQITQTQLGLRYTKTIGTGIANVQVFGTYRDLANPLPFGIITVNRWAGGARGAYDFSAGPIDLSMGGEVKIQRDDRTEFENTNARRGDVTINQLEEVDNQAAFVTASYKWNNWNVLGSLRYDVITFRTDSAANNQTGNRSFQSFNPNIGLGYSAGFALLYANLNTAFEAPTTTELVNRPDGGTGYNPDLQPERTVGLEAGSRGQVINNKVQYDVALYQLWIRDLLFPYQLTDNGPTFYRNQGETRHRGVELTTTVRPHPQWAIQGMYTLTDAQFIRAETPDGQSLAGNTVPAIARHRARAALRWMPNQFWMELSSEMVSSYPVNNGNTAQNGAYQVTDFRISYETPLSSSGARITPFVNVYNLFDARYNSSVSVNAFGGRFFEPAPGRNWRAGLSLEF